MAVGGLLLVALSWAWPPALFLLVIWMLYRTRLEMGTRSGRVQLSMVFAIPTVAAIGGGYETVREVTDANAMPATGTVIDVGGHKLYLNRVAGCS